MRNELILKNGSTEHKVFFQDGFYSAFLMPTPIHKHNYAEIHLVTDDAYEFYIDGRRYSSKDGNLLIIPRGIPHCIPRGENRVCHAAFQIDCDVNVFSSCHVRQQVARDFIDEIEKCKETKDYTVICAYIRLFCGYLQIDQQPKVRPITDYGFLICEFFSKHYAEDPRLSDLAKELHLSERQTERLVIKYTGHTFRQELSALRMEMAKHLLDRSDMSLGQIAQCVGYRSYTGFWKAIKKHDKCKGAV